VRRGELTSWRAVRAADPPRTVAPRLERSGPHNPLVGLSRLVPSSVGKTSDQAELVPDQAIFALLGRGEVSPGSVALFGWGDLLEF